MVSSGNLKEIIKQGHESRSVKKNVKIQIQKLPLFEQTFSIKLRMEIG